MTFKFFSINNYYCTTILVEDDEPFGIQETQPHDSTILAYLNNINHNTSIGTSPASIGDQTSVTRRDNKNIVLNSTAPANGFIKIFL